MVAGAAYGDAACVGGGGGGGEQGQVVGKVKRSDLSLGGHDRAGFLPSEVVEVWGDEDWVQKQRDVGKANVTVGVLVPSDWGKRQPN